MRMAYVCADSGVPVFGRKGCSIHVQEVIRALRGQGAKMELLASRIDGSPPADLQDMAVHNLPRAAKGALAAREQQALAANDAVRETLRRKGPWDAVYERYSLWSFAGMEHAAEAGVCGLLEVNAPLIEEQAEHRGLLDFNGAVRASERAFTAASALIAVSEEVAAYLNRFPDAVGKVNVIPNGVNAARFPAGMATRLPAAAGTFTVGFVGTLKPWHGVSMLLDALARLRRQDLIYHGLIVGDGPQRAVLEDQVAYDPLLRGAVKFTGAVAPEEVPGLLASMDVAVAPYPDLPEFYFSPLKVYEYMAAGRASVASRIGQLESLIQDGLNGLLCPPGDAIALADAIRRLQSDPVLRARMGVAARAGVLEKHGWDFVARRILCLARRESSPIAAGEKSR